MSLRHAEFERLEGLPVEVLSPWGGRGCLALGGWRRVARLHGCPDPSPRPSCKGSLVGQRLSDHPDVRKIGFTGSTEVGKHIMKR